MPDWEQLLRQKLVGVRVPAARLDEIVAEIAAHLGEVWREQEPFSTAEAFLDAQLGDLAEFRARLEHVENPGAPVSERYRHFWMPAFVGLALIETVYWTMWALRVVHWVPGSAYLARPFGVEFPVSLVLVGGLSALLSRRSGGTRLCAIAAGIAPAIARYGPPALANSVIAYAMNRPQSLMMYTNVIPLACLVLGALLFSLVARAEHAPR